MARTIAGPVLFFLVVLIIIGIPAGLVGYFELASLSTAGSGVAMFLIGFIIGYVRRWFVEDNIRNIVAAVTLIAFVSYFTPLRPVIAAILYAVAYFLGKRAQHSETKIPYKI
ncbi:MAG: hypothetical protein MUP66_03620 [Candidatus Nanohaloarchaeota archaeon QJJ-5]|nr:hypothetical protein [Candidatus Nanohaloarchaeota archaeon QJJ-5]